ncbi:hypothetical protein QZH41_006850 [Actinostola sp. cb2023]|nr:hypothetical protein QZH41_006850 [Actinostola sp. cb2023]
MKIIGAIDGSLIPIKAPNKEEHLYVCHKGFHAINVMAVCNADLVFTNVLAKWHGSTHDSAVFNTSELQYHLENGGGRDGWLLGDRGYALQPYLMTPFRPANVVTEPEKRYQSSHTKTRNTIERCFGLWKQRFRCVDVSGGAMQFEPSRCCRIILAIAVLHNMCLKDNTDLPLGADAVVEQGGAEMGALQDVNTQAGSQVRARLINDVFT